MKVYRPPERTQTHELRPVLPRTKTVDLLPNAPVYAPTNEPVSSKMANEPVRAVKDLERVIEVLAQEEFNAEGRLPEFHEATWMVEASDKHREMFHLASGPLDSLFGRKSFEVWHHPSAFTKGVKAFALRGVLVRGLLRLLAKRKQGMRGALKRAFGRSGSENILSHRADIDCILRGFGRELLEYLEWAEEKASSVQGAEDYGLLELRQLLKVHSEQPQMLHQWRDEPPESETLLRHS